MNNISDLSRLRDPKFYLETFCKIKNKEGGLIPFKLNEAQKDLFNTLNSGVKKILICKARQLGFSTAVAGYFYHYCIMNPGITAGLIGYNSDLVSELLDKVKTFIRTTPEKFRPTIQYNSKYEISFPKMDSKIVILPSSENVGSGYTLNLCLSGNTKILTEHGKTKLIKDINDGDVVINGKGGRVSVKKIIKRKTDKNMVSINASGMEDKLVLTYDHLVLSRNNKTNEPEWKEAGKFEKGDYVAYPYFQVRERHTKINIDDCVRKNYKNNGLKKEINIDYDFGLLMGWYLAEGTVDEYQTMFSLDVDEVDEFLKLANKFSEYVQKISVRKGGESRTRIVVMYGANFARCIEKYFGRTENKRIDDCIFYWGRKFVDGLLFGIFCGDGCFNRDDIVVLTNTNEGVINQVRKLLVSRRIGFSNIYRNDNCYRYEKKCKTRYDLILTGGGNYKFRRWFGLSLPIYKSNRAAWRRENQPWANQGNHRWRRGKFYYWAKVVDVSPSEDEEYVYDIALEKSPHSFLTNAGVVHNCLITELSKWDKAEEKMTSLGPAIPKNAIEIIETCVTGDTILFTDSGPRFMRDIHNWDNHELGFSEGKKILLDGHYGMQPTTTYFNSGKKNGLRIKTRDGYELGMSDVHKLYVLDGCDLKFVKSKDLKVGDRVAIKYGQERWGSGDDVDWTPTPHRAKNKQWIKLFNPKKITKDIAYLLGLILGDGYIDFKNGRVTITTIDEDVSNFLLKNDLGLKFYKGVGANDYHYTCKNKSFVEFLGEFIKFKNVKSREKSVPEIVLGWSEKNVASFLSGLFDADGCCRGDRGTISLVSTSKDIINVVRVLLLNFGILTKTYSHVSCPTKRVSVSSLHHTLEISGYHGNRFIEKIGFRIKRKNKNISKSSGGCKYKAENIPGIGHTIRKYRSSFRLKTKDLNGLQKSFYSKSGTISYESLGKILELSRNKNFEIYHKLKKLNDWHYHYDEVVDIQPIHENVYDFTVDNGHTVTYSGVVGHQTPKGAGNLYHRMYVQAERGESNYTLKNYLWWWGYSRADMDMVIKDKGQRYFDQEYNGAFLTSGRSVFDTNMIKKLYKLVLKVGDKNGEHTVYENDHLRVYKEPEPDATYCCGVDVSEGVEGGDYSVATIWNRTTGEEVAMYRNHMSADRLGDILNIIGRRYNNALMVVEINNHGLTTVSKLKNLLYPNLYFRQQKFETMSSGLSDRIGWKTNKLTRPLMIDDLNMALRDGSLTPHSKELIDEMLVFVYDEEGNMDHQPGFHDDTLFATAMANQGFKILYSGIPEQINTNNYMPSTFAY